MSYEKAEALLAKYKDGTATDEEKALVEKWLSGYPGERIKFTDDHIYRVSREIWAKLPQPAETGTRSLFTFTRIAAAAAVLVFLATGSYFFIHKRPQQQAAQNRVQDIAPPVNKAILTLANGKKIILNSANNGLIAQQGNSAISKSANGAIVYSQSTDNSLPNTAALAYNDITIPRGGQYQLVILPDGSKVWLNSASSMRYPTTFSGSERKVTITGEAYFEVKHDPGKPFRVVSNGQTVEVLGTHFNINAYSDEDAVKTTLLQGSVKVTSGPVSNMIKPGEQAQFKNGNIKVVDADVDEAIAWKNGQFMFESDNIKYIMRVISRWYNVDVEYCGQIPADNFGGGTSRFSNVSEVLNILELTGKVHFKIDGRKIIVSK